MGDLHNAKEPVISSESSTDEDIIPPEDDLMEVSDVTYSIEIQTSSERGSGTHANIWIDICGVLGDTGESTVRKPNQAMSKRFSLLCCNPVCLQVRSS